MEKCPKCNSDLEEWYFELSPHDNSWLECSNKNCDWEHVEEDNNGR